MLLLGCVAVAPVRAQQRPLKTEDPKPIGAGRVLVEGGVDYAQDQHYPVSGLSGNLMRLPTIGVSIGLSSIAELQFDGGVVNRLAITNRQTAPLSHLVTATGNATRDVEDVVVATKIRIVPESGRRPAFGIRFATRLPNASNESGLGLDTTDFSASILTAKTVQSVRVAGNIGLGILGDPTDGQRQNDAVVYGASVARALSDVTELVGELNGRVSTRQKALPGTETRGSLLLGARYTKGPVRFDGGIFFGLASSDPTVGFTGGFTYVFNAFTVP